MSSKSPLPKRPRLPGYDYSEAGYYFVTIITNNKFCTLSHIRDAQTVLSPLGEVFENQLLDLPKRFPHVSISSHVIMPNHVHILIRIGYTTIPVELSRIVNELKSKTTVKYNKSIGRRTSVVWQYSYYDVIIRTEKQLLAVRQYINDNPIKWELDRLNPMQRKTAQAPALRLRLPPRSASKS